MSKRRKPNPNNHRKNKPIYSEEESKRLDEELGEDEPEEEEYDPEDVYEEADAEEEEEEEDDYEEPVPKIDPTKLSEKTYKAYENNNKKLVFLKALALDVYQDTRKLSKMCGLYSDSMAMQVISTLLGMISETSQDIDYPARILRYFNRLVPNGFPNKVKLNASDINELTNLVRVYEEKLQNAAKITDPAKIFGEGEIKDPTKTINPAAAQKEHKVMMDANQQQDSSSDNVGSRIPIENGEIYPAPDTSKDINFYAGRYPTPDVGLMEMALRRIPNPRPNSINSFIISFSDLYTDWMQNPMKMLEELKFFFGPTHGEHAYRLWKDYRERYMKQQGYSSLPQNGGMTGEYSPYNFPQQNGMQPMMGGMQPMGVSPELEAERMAERRMNKMMQMIQMRMMEKAMENQTPTPIMGQNYEEVLDQNGKVIKRIFLSNGHANGGNNPLESSLFQGMMNVFGELIRGKNQEMVEVMKKINSPDSLMTDFTKTIMSNFVTQQNPVSQIKEMLDITNLVKTQTNPQGESVGKTIEAVKLDVDSKIAMQELELRKLEMQHNWRMDEKQVAEQDQNVDKWLNVMLQMGEGIIKPVAMKFVEGLGGANKVGNPLAMFAGQQQQQQVPQPPPTMPPQYQQAQAMQEQRYYQAQQQQQEPPLQPIPPNRSYNQQSPQPQNFRTPMQKPVSQISDQQLNQELSQLSPEQIQEVEDRMALDDINREKVRNALRAHKNARRFARTAPPQPSPQQQEAQNVLFNTPPPDELESILDDEDDDDELEEDDFDQDGEEREVPIAKGIDKTVANRVESQKLKSFKEFAPETSTDVASKKKMTQKQRAMYAEGQMSDRQVAMLPDSDVEEEDKDDSTGWVPMPAGIYNESDEKLKEENLKQTRQTPPRKSRAKPKKEEEPEKSEEEKDKIVEEAENVLEEAELIPSDVDDSE